MDCNVVRFSLFVFNHTVKQVSAVNIMILSFCLLLHQVNLVDSGGNNITREGKIVGFDPDYDLAVLKVIN